MDNIKISAVIIAFNEEAYIQGCIDSVKNVVDEIVVVDSFSTDKTEEICKSNGVQFLRHPWEGYGKQKNWGNSQATHDHILSLDADERLSDGLKQAIVKIKGKWQYDVYALSRLTYFQGQKLSHCMYPDRQLRLFDRRKTHWNENMVHEIIIIGEGIKLKHIKKNIIHIGKINIHAHVETLNNYSTLSAYDSFHSGKRPSMLKLIFSPFALFMRNYFLKLGFLDGIVGFIICINLAHYNFLKYAKRIEFYKTGRPDGKTQTTL